MENIIEYVENNMKTFDDKGFNVVDSLILSELAYIKLENIVPSVLDKKAPVKVGELLKAELFPEMLQNTPDKEEHIRFIFALAASPRFRNTNLNYYINNHDMVSEKQFSAVTFFLDDKSVYIAYRGTDSTFVGWKEDFNMTYISPVPAQEDGVRYLNTIAKKIPKTTTLRVGGHSKGGNIAVYSAVKCDPLVQKRIHIVYNHDGPGFKENIFESPEFLSIKDRIHTTLPEAALVGMLLQHYKNYVVIKCNRRGVIQHDPFTWNVENDDFCYAPKISNSALVRSKTINGWLDSLDNDKRRLIIDILFQVLEKTENESFSELSEKRQKSVASMIETIKDSDPEIKKLALNTINELAKLSVKNFFAETTKTNIFPPQ